MKNQQIKNYFYKSFDNLNELKCKSKSYIGKLESKINIKETL